MSALVSLLVAHAWHQIGCKCGWVNPVPLDSNPEEADVAYAAHVARAIEGAL